MTGGEDSDVFMLNYWILNVRDLVLFCVLPVMAGAGVGWLGWVWQSDSTAFVENLLTAEGRIQRFEPGEASIQMHVQYVDVNGVPYTQRFPVNEGEMARLRPIGTVSLVYDRRDPRRAELGHVVSANNEMLFDWTVLATGVLLILAGLGYLGIRARQILGISRLFREGQIVLTEVRDFALAPGGAVGRFTYAFRGPNGRWYEGKSPELPAQQLAAWPVGRSLLAAYNPRDPRRSVADVFGVAEGRRRELPQTA
jgi:hypothetical protein